MGARRLGTILVAAMLWTGAARAQSTGTGTNPGGTGSSGTGSTGTGSTGSGSAQQGGATGSAGGVTFDPAAQAAARLFGVYRVPGAPPLDSSGVYRVDLGSSAPPAGSGGGGAGSTTGSATSTSATTSTTTGSVPTSAP
jgi:hypothetical protein